MRSGYGAREEARLAADGRAGLADAVFDSLAAAMPWLLARLAPLATGTGAIT